MTVVVLVYDRKEFPTYSERGSWVDIYLMNGGILIVSLFVCGLTSQFLRLFLHQKTLQTTPWMSLYPVVTVVHERWKADTKVWNRLSDGVKWKAGGWKVIHDRVDFPNAGRDTLVLKLCDYKRSLSIKSVFIPSNTWLKQRHVYIFICHYIKCRRDGHRSLHVHLPPHLQASLSVLWKRRWDVYKDGGSWSLRFTECIWRRCHSDYGVYIRLHTWIKWFTITSSSLCWFMVIWGVQYSLNLCQYS